MLNDYYNILGVSDKATLDEIKSAFRQKAKELHPDINHMADAQEHFILLVEAYEYLRNLKSGKIKSTPSDSSGDWKREQARRKGRKYAQMRYEDFVKSDHSETISSLEIIFRHLFFIFGIALIFVLPIVGAINNGWTGFFITLFFVFITLPISINALLTFPKLSVGKFISSMFFMMKTIIFYFVFITGLNIYLIFRIGFQTLVPLSILFLIFFISILITYAATKWIMKNSNNFKKLFISVCIAPLVINLFLLLNFVYSSSATFENYNYTKKLNIGRGGKWEETSFIILENNKYSDFAGLRYFIDYESLKGSNIKYTFKEGLFGLRVMTDYETK